MKVLVTGARGILGSELVALLSERHTVTGVDIEDFDVADEQAAKAALRSARPDAVVHCAAFTDVDGAETSFAAAFRVNGIGTKNMVLAANDVAARFVYVSTDYVFDGTAGRAYVETDVANPVGVYGRSKWMGEVFVRDLARDFSIVRTQALYGDRGRSFVSAILERIRSGSPLRVVRDQVVCPTRAKDLAAAIRRILEEGGPGIYHASSREECTWFDFARAILKEAGVSDHPLSEISSEELARPAPRPQYSVLRNLHLELTIGDTLPTWREGLRAHFEDRGGTPCAYS